MAIKIIFPVILTFAVLSVLPDTIHAQCPPGPTTQPGAIGGSNPVCPGQVVVYTATIGTDAATTTWSVPGTWTINGTSLVYPNTTLTTTVGTVSGNVCVYAWSAGCGNSATTCQFITVNTNSSDPTGINISTNPICPGNSTTLTVQGGSLGTGANWQWYTNGCGVTNVGTGSSIAVSPGSTTQYWVRAEGTCNITNCATNTVNVKTQSTAPASITATSNPICNGNSTQLSVNGGSLGTGANWYWYTTACGGAPVGSGSPIVVAPGSSTTYYVRAEGDCNTTGCANLLITVNSLSTDPTGINASVNPLCSGNSTTLTVTGGSLGTGASWQWYTAGCGSGGVGSGSPFVVSPASTTTYWVRAEGTCNNTNCVNTSITVVTTPTANAGSDGTECDLTHNLAAVPSIGTGTWSQSSGPGSSSFSNANDPNATVTATAYGSYNYTWTENNGGCTSSDTKTVIYYQQPTSNAGNDATVCGALSTNFAAVPSAGVGTWAQVAGPGASGYSNPNAPNATVTVSTWGTYTYSWTENNGGCTSSDQIVLTFDQQPVADAGTATDQCDLDVNLSATPSVGTGTWTQFIGPGTTTFSAPNNPNTTATVTQYGTYMFRWTEVNGGCSSSDDVTLTFYQQPIADAGADNTICGLLFDMQAVYTVGTGTWSLVSGTGSATFSNINSVNTTVTVSATGAYTFEWFVDNSGCQDRDTVILNFTSATPPVADAGSDGSICSNSYTLAAVPSVGTGTWTQVTGPGTSSYSNANDPNAVVTITAYGTYLFRWTEVNGTCSDFDEATVNFFENPLADAGLDDTVCRTTYTFNASGQPGSPLWSQIAGAGTTSFSNVNSPTATGTASVNGTYTYEWSVDNNGCANADTIVIVYQIPPVSNAGADNSDCDLDVVLSATPSIGTGTWTQVSGTGSTSFSNVNDPAATATATLYGTYVYRWTESNGACIDNDDVTINFNEIPLADAGADDSLCATSYYFNAASSTGIGLWTQIGGPGTSSFTKATSPISSVTVSAAGTYTYEWTVNNNGCISSDTIVVIFSSSSVTNAGTDANECDLDAILAAVAGGPGTWTQVFGPGSTSFSDNTDPNATVTVTMYGTYIYRWTETAGACSSSDDVTINFLSVPLADAGPDGAVCSLSYTFNASASAGTGTWNQVAGTGTTSYSNVNSPIATATATLSGAYTYEWSVNNNGCISSDTIVVNYSTPPTADGGPNGNECDLNYTFAAVLSTGTGTWSQSSGPGTSSFSNVNDPAATVTVTAYGNYIFQWTETSGLCSDADEVNVTFALQPIANAGADGSSCATSETLGATPPTGTGTWSQASGAGVASFSNANDPFATANVTQSGAYEFEWTVNNYGCISRDTVQITFDTLPASNAGPGGTECDLDFTLAAVPSFGSGTWSQVSGPGLTSFSNVNNPAAAAMASTYGSYIYQWTEQNGSCSDQDTLIVNFIQQPSPNAGSDAQVCGLIHNFSAIPPASGNGTWQQTGGPGTSVFGNVNNPNSNVTVDVYGTYNYRWVVDNNGCNSFDEITVFFYEPPVISAGIDTTECDLSHAFTGSVSVGTATWLQLSGSGMSTYGNVNDPQTTVTVNGYGSYVYQLGAVNGVCSMSDQVIVTFAQQPVANAGNDISDCAMTTTLSATPPAGTGTWSQVSGTGTATFSDSNDPFTNVSVDMAGSYQFQWSVVNYGCSSTDLIQASFDTLGGADAGPSGVECDLDYTFSAVPPTGTGTWSQVSGPGLTAFSNFNDPAATAFATDPGLYIYRWLVQNGTCESSDTVTVRYLLAPVVYAGSDQSKCSLTAQLSVTSSPPVGTWSQESGPGTSTFGNATSVITSVTADTYGTYDYIWTASNNGCIATDTVKVSYYQTPIADAGTGSSVCTLTTTLIAVPSIGIGIWNQLFGSGVATFGNPNNSTTTVTGSNYGTYVLQWTETNGVCMSTDTVAVQFNQGPLVDAGSDASICGFSYDLNGFNNSGNAQWTQTSGGGTSSFINSSDPTTQVTVSAYGIFTFQLKATNNACSDSDAVTINFLPPTPTNAGPDDDACGLSYTLNALSTFGFGTWSQVAGTGTASIASPSSAASPVTVDIPGAYIFQWLETSGTCSDTDSVTVTFYDIPAPGGGIGGDMCGTTFTLNAVPDIGGGTWTMVSGPGSASFTSTTSPSTDATISSYGTYIFRWAETNGPCSGYGDVSVNFYQQPSPSAGSDDGTCGSDYMLIANPTVVNGSWSQTGGPGTSVFDDPLSPIATVTADTNGVYTYSWNETNGPCSGSDAVVISFVNQPTANAGPDGNVCSLSYSLSATATGTSGSWSVAQGGTAIFSDTNNLATTVTVPQPGLFVFRFTTTNIGCSDYDEVAVSFYPVPSAYAGTDTTISLGDFVQLSGSSGDSIVWEPSTGLSSSSVSNPIASPVVNTKYTLTVYNDYGCSSSDEVTINVTTDYDVTPGGVLTPDGNGINDTWIIDNIEFYKDCDVMVFNRYGNIVFRMTGYDNSWKGTYNGGYLPDGTYHYLIVCPGSGKETVKRGVITILR